MITVVSGLPRSGTSLMMQILEANGFEILTDKIRIPDENNPSGYYEYERVKSLMKDNSWLSEAEGKAVKVISQLLPYLSLDYEYNVIFMERNLDEVIASQFKMLERLGKGNKVQPEILIKTFKLQLDKSLDFIKKIPNFKFVRVNFNQLFIDAEPVIETIKRNFNISISLKKSVEVIHPELYREKL